MSKLLNYLSCSSAGCPKLRDWIQVAVNRSWDYHLLLAFPYHTVCRAEYQELDARYCGCKDMACKIHGVHTVEILITMVGGRANIGWFHAHLYRSECGHCRDRTSINKKNGGDSVKCHNCKRAEWPTLLFLIIRCDQSADAGFWVDPSWEI